MIRYRALNEQEIRHSLHMQATARLRPERIMFPEGWVPSTQLDKLVARNLIMDMQIEKIMKLFPQFSVGFVKRVKEKDDEAV